MSRNNIDTGRMAFALAQITLSMLISAGILGAEVATAAAHGLKTNGVDGLSELETSTLVEVIRSSAAK